MEALVRRAQAGTKFSLTLIVAFTSVAVLLVTVGLHGVLSTVVRQRTAEIGARMALGATPGLVLYMVVGYALRLSLAGVALGTAAAVGFTRGMTSMLVGVAPTDPSTFLATAILFVAIAAASSWLPARRAAQLGPAIAVREE
jgi:putative ABC transport system permease protein